MSAGDGQELRGDPFGFLAPDVVVTEADRQRLDRHEVLARTLPGKDGQLAVFVATRLNAEPDALVAWTRAIAELKRSTFVLAIGRFSSPPTVSDLDALVLDEVDLTAIRACVPGNCGLKLSAPEIRSLKKAAAAAGPAWRDAVQREFRRVIVERVDLYNSRGIAGLPPMADRARPHDPVDALTAIIDQSPYLTRLPEVMHWLQKYPDADGGIESFFYWSKEQYGEGKPVISVTHVGIRRPRSDRALPALLVAGKQIFATHYVDGALGLTMVLRDGRHATSYLAYVNRSQVDVLRGFFGPFVRGVLEGRVKRQAPVILRGLRNRLESGVPPDDPFGQPEDEPPE